MIVPCEGVGAGDAEVMIRNHRYHVSEQPVSIKGPHFNAGAELAVESRVPINFDLSRTGVPDKFGGI